MKHLRNVLALVLAAVLAVVLGVAPAFADNTGGGDTPADGDAPTPHSITITNTNSSISINGKTYSAYKLLDSTHSGDAYAYTMKTSSQFYDTTLVTGTPAENSMAAVLKQYFTFTAVPGDTTKVNVQPVSGFDARAFADAMQKFLSGLTATKTGTASGETCVITLDADEAGQGYYLVTGGADPKDPKASETVESAVIVTNEDPSPVCYPKAGIPTLNKKITGEHVLDEAGKAATAQVGSTVSFQLDSVVPDTTGYSKYTFIISDTMSAGLTFTDPEGDATNDVVVKINDVDKTSDVTVATSGQTLTVTIPKTVLDAATKGQAIVVTYSAVVNQKALTTDYENNTANLEYSNNPYEDTTNKTPDKKVYVIDVDINVDKVANSATGDKLSGAKFKVFKGATQPADTSLAWYKWDATNKKVTWVTKADADEFKTNASGKFQPAVQGLEAEKTGTAYGLLETAAPTGYNLLADPVIVTLTATYAEASAEDGGATTATVTASGATVTNGTVTLSADPTADQPLATAQVINQSGTELPSTGGMGTTILYTIGGIMLVGGAIALVSKKRVANMEK